LNAFVDLWSPKNQRSTHTNYLTELLKSFPEVFIRERRSIMKSTACPVKNQLDISKLPVIADPLESAYSTVRQRLVNNLFFKPFGALRATPLCAALLTSGRSKISPDRDPFQSVSR
jgi:hypothetical protein